MNEFTSYFDASNRHNLRTTRPVQGYVRLAPVRVAHPAALRRESAHASPAGREQPCRTWRGIVVPVKLLTPARQIVGVPRHRTGRRSCAIVRVVGHHARHVRGGDTEDHVRMPSDGPTPVRGRPGPKPRGRSVVPLTITVTPVQRAALSELAAVEKTSVSAVARRFITTGLAADAVR
jgi:hypothetical protein